MIDRAPLNQHDFAVSDWRPGEKQEYNATLESEAMEWQVKAWEKDPKKRPVAIVAIFIAGLAGLLILNHPLFSLLGMIVIFISTAELFLPMKFRVDANEARQSCGISVTAIRWADVKRLIKQEDGVRLSPFENPNRLDAFRGVFLRYASNEDEVLGKIAELWKIDAISLDARTDDRSGGRVG